MYFVYFLRSLKRERFYIGSSANPKKRLIEHNKGGTPSTKPYRPWELVYTESFEFKRDATKREWYLKHPVGYLEKKAIIEQYKKRERSL
jgi:putative endonuclease